METKIYASQDWVEEKIKALEDSNENLPANQEWWARTEEVNEVIYSGNLVFTGTTATFEDDDVKTKIFEGGSYWIKIGDVEFNAQLVKESLTCYLRNPSDESCYIKYSAFAANKTIYVYKSTDTDETLHVEISGSVMDPVDLPEKFLPECVVKSVNGNAPDKKGNVNTPEALPNPHALTFTGAVEATYDGSGAVSVEIPGGGGGGKFVKKTYQFELAENASYVDIDLGGTYDILQVYGNGFIPATTLTSSQSLFIGKDTMGQWNSGFLIGRYKAWTSDTYMHFRVWNNVHNLVDDSAKNVVINSLYGESTVNNANEIAKNINWGYSTPSDMTGLCNCSVLRIQFANRQRELASGTKMTITINALEV